MLRFGYTSPIQHAGYERLSYPFLATLLTACVTPPNGDQVAPELGVAISREATEVRPVLSVAITNHSPTPICIRAEALQNPHSHEMELRLRDPAGRTLRLRRVDLVEPPLTGIIRVEPGGRIRGEYSLTRFRGIDSTTPFPRGLIARAAFRYGLCDDVWSFRTQTAWTPI